MAARSARQIRTRGRQSRRELLAAATGGLGALAAQAAFPAAAAQAARRAPATPAAQGAAVIEGRDNTGAAARTAVFTTGNKEFGILADPNSSGHGSLGVYGGGQDAGVRGDALNVGGTGVIGFGGSDGVGVWGEGGGGTDGNGVTGATESTGQLAAAGVHGFNNGTGPGVRGTGGIGVQATGAIALQVLGPAQFRRSGKATIRHPATSVTVTVPDGLSAGSLAFALAQTQLPGVYVTSAVPDRANGTLRIHLNKSPGTSSRPATVTVAWFILS